MITKIEAIAVLARTLHAGSHIAIRHDGRQWVLEVMVGSIGYAEGSGKDWDDAWGDLGCDLRKQAQKKIAQLRAEAESDVDAGEAALADREADNLYWLTQEARAA